MAKKERKAKEKGKAKSKPEGKKKEKGEVKSKGKDKGKGTEKAKLETRSKTKDKKKGKSEAKAKGELKTKAKGKDKVKSKAKGKDKAKDQAKPKKKDKAKGKDRAKKKAKSKGEATPKAEKSVQPKEKVEAKDGRDEIKLPVEVAAQPASNPAQRRWRQVAGKLGLEEQVAAVVQWAGQGAPPVLGGFAFVRHVESDARDLKCIATGVNMTQGVVVRREDGALFLTGRGVARKFLGLSVPWKKRTNRDQRFLTAQEREELNQPAAQGAAAKSSA